MATTQTAQVIGATGNLEDCCEGRLFGRHHSPDCPRLVPIQFSPTSRDEEIAMALQAAELSSPTQVEMAPGPVTYSMVDPVWGEVVMEEPSCVFRCCFSCCPCCVVGCRTPEAKKAWRRFLLSMSFFLSVVQVLILIVIIILDGGFVSLKENPMLGPHFHRLDAAGAKNAAKIAWQGEVWRLASATMLHAGWIHLVGNVVVQIRAGVQLEMIWGTPAWLLIYFSSGIYANLLSCVLHPGALGVGSSGCLCGLIGGWLSFLLITWNQTMPNDVKMRNVGEAKIPTNLSGDASFEFVRQIPNDVKMRNAQTSSILISIVLVVVFSFMPLMDLAAHIGGLLMGVGVCMTVFGNRLQDRIYKWVTIVLGMVLIVTLWAATGALFANTKIPSALLDLCQRPDCD